jgi:predicted ATPase
VVGAGRDLAALLTRCPELAFLATSRPVLGLAAEQEYPVPSFFVPATGLSGELARHSLIYLGIRIDNSKKRAAG